MNYKVFVTRVIYDGDGSESEGELFSIGDTCNL